MVVCRQSINGGRTMVPTVQCCLGLASFRLRFGGSCRRHHEHQLLSCESADQPAALAGSRLAPHRMVGQESEQEEPAETRLCTQGKSTALAVQPEWWLGTPWRTPWIAEVSTRAMYLALKSETIVQGGLTEGPILSSRDTYQESHTKPSDIHFSSPSRWSASRQAYSYVRRSPCWLNNQYNSVWTESHVDAQPQKNIGLRLSYGSSFDTSCYDIEQACKQGHLNEALHILLCMEGQGTVPSANIYKSFLQVCMTKRALGQAKQVHAQVARHGLEFAIGEYMVSALVKCGGLEDALQLFYRLPRRTIFSWTAVISGYANNGQGREALRLYQLMQDEKVLPNTYTFVSLLKACGSIPDLQAGKRIHAEVLRYNCESNSFVGSSLVDMYGKCGSIVNAKAVFDKMLEQGVVSWNAMLAVYTQQGQAGMALELYQQMQEQGVSPNDRTFVIVLQACGMLADEETDSVDVQPVNGKVLGKGKTLHADALRKGYVSDVFVASTLVSMYGKCRSTMDAWNVFERLLDRNVVSWNAMLSAYVEQRQEEKALQLFTQMQQEGVSPDGRTFVAALQACCLVAEKEKGVTAHVHSTKINSLHQGKVLHAHAWRKGHSSHAFVGNTLISMYGKCRSNLDRQYVFDELSQRDKVSWNVMLASCAEQGEADTVLKLYGGMLEESVSPDSWTFVSIFQACNVLVDKEEDVGLDGTLTKAMSLARGKSLHAAAEMKGYTLDAFVANSLVSMYGRCGVIADAQHAFDKLFHRDVVSWNAMIAASAQLDQANKALNFYKEMREEGVNPNERTFVSVLQSCGMLAMSEKESIQVDGHFLKLESLQKGKAIHADAHKSGYDSDVFTNLTLITLYGMCGSLADAQECLDGLHSQQDVMSWNALLKQYLEAGNAERSLSLYEQMQEAGVSPDAWTFVSTLSACGILAEKEDPAGDGYELGPLNRVKAIHGEVRRRGLHSDVFISSTLLTVYGKCKSIVDAKNVFDRLCWRDVVAWTSMLAAYVEQSQAEKALHLYEQMREEGMTPDDRTFVTILLACIMVAEKEHDVSGDQFTKARSLEKGKAIHAEAQRIGYDADLFVGNTLMSMYAKCGNIVDAYNVFKGMPELNVVSWTAMLVAFVDQGQAEEALYLYRRMQHEGPRANDITLVSVVRACIKTGSLALVRQIHHSLVSTGVALSPLLAGSLINAYGKCATMMDAQRVFDALPHPDVVSWTALIAGYAREGDTAATLKQYEKMQLAGVNPNGVTFLSLLSACSHAGLVDEGVAYLESMVCEFGLTPEIEHYATMIDLFGRAGCFEKLQELLSTLPVEPSLGMWLCVLCACRKYGKVALGEHAFRCAVRLQPQHAAAYLLMSNIYDDKGLSDQANNLKMLRQRQGAWKMPGRSWIEYEQKSHTFLANDLNHEQLYDLLRKVDV